MAFTPLIKKLNSNGTTFYTFSSASKDLSKCLANTQKDFVFSHFVCLNIPNCINTRNGAGNNSSSIPSSPLTKNFFQFSGLNFSYGIDNFDGTTKSTSKKIADHLQGYVYNFEEKLISESDDNTTDRSVAERIFWHWMKECLAMNWKFDSSKISPELRNQSSPRFIEGNTSLSEYENVVKYIGDIDITNNVDIAQEAYTEVYVHIPSEVGNTPTVLFKQEFDGNFEEGGEYGISNNQTYIIGQTIVGPASQPDRRAIYDSAYTDTNTRYILANEVAYGAQPTNTAYTTGANGYKTSIDGLCIDFDSNSYNDIVSSNIPNMYEFNKLGSTFEYNAVLIYYDIVDRSSGTRTSNLYGVLFLDDAKSVVPGWDYNQRYPKYKPVAGVQNGNSYGFKLNLRIDIEPDKTGITTLVNEYNTFSMSLFTDALTRMQECSDMFIKTKENLTNIESRLSDMETLLTTVSNYNDLVSEVEELKTELENANLAFADRSSLLDLISNVNDNVNSILSGRANVQLQYNTDVIRSGYGIDVDTNSPNQVSISNKNYGYSVTNPIRIDNTAITESNPLDLNDPNDISNNVIFQLMQASNMARIYTTNQASQPINIQIQTSYNNWKPGQNVKIVFPNLTLTNLNSNDIKITTSSQTITISNSLLNLDNPIIELTCISPSANEFVYDIIR